MNTHRVKRIAVLAGALLMGAVIAGPVSFSNIPIINSAGQPVVQIVVGSHSAPSDGVVAANIAAVIGNLAYTSTPVTATVQGTSAVKCVPAATATCTVTNQQVWLGESGIAAPSGSYAFAGLIGSVLNRAVKLGAPQYAKSLQNSTNTQYAYPISNSIQSSPAASPYYQTIVPTSIGVTYNYNGGGVSFAGFTSNSQYDNIIRITPAEVPSLASNFGPGGENEYIWVTGFPVYDQNAGNFALLDAGGALQLVFSKPIPLRTSSGSFNNAVISIAGQNWTIIGGNYMNLKATPTTFVQGGKLTLAQSMTPLTTVYVGHNLTSGPFTVQVADLGQPANGISPADINVYYNGVLTNTTSITPPGQAVFNVSGQHLYVKVTQTFAGLYAYEKWAKVQLFSNEFNLTNGQAFNKTTNPGWNVFLYWTNATTSGPANELQSIVIYNTSPVQTLLPGQSFDFLTNPAEWKLTFVGETLPTGNFDPLTISTSYSSSEQYRNLGYPGPAGVPAPSNITEPAQLLVVKSSIPNAFTYQGETNNTVTYDLTPYALYEVANALAYPENGMGSIGVNVILQRVAGNYLGTAGNPTVSVTVTGYPSNTASAPTSVTVTFNGLPSLPQNAMVTSTNFFNITSITLNEALPGANVIVATQANSANVLAILAQPLTTSTNSPEAGLLYPVSGYSYPWISVGSPITVTYSQNNGQPLASFILKSNSAAPSGSGHAMMYYTYTLQEFPVPTNATANDMLGFSIYNSTAGASAVLN
ncbi:MAG: S-layer protein, partial [Candidatus Micrarchaeia archaeon]